MNDFHVSMKIAKLKKHVFICKSCEKKTNLNHMINIWNHIIHNPLDMKFISMLNKIEKHITKPHFVFAQTLKQ